jgi:uncharacterized protein YndB with AHSA1/START domain
MSQYRIVQDYPHAPTKVWRALTDPALVPLWTATGMGARPVGFSTKVGTKFQYVGKPMRGWEGIVHCEVLEVREPSLLRYSWIGQAKDDVTEVTCRLVQHDGGTRLTFDHSGFSGIRGYIVSKILASVRKKMLRVGLPPVLDALDENGNLRPGAPFGPKPERADDTKGQ